MEADFVCVKYNHRERKISESIVTIDNRCKDVLFNGAVMLRKLHLEENKKYLRAQESGTVN